MNDAFKAAQAALYQQHRQPGNTGNWWSVGLKEVEGDTVTIDVRIVLKCVMNRRAKARSKEVMAAVKAARLVKQQEQAELERRQDEQTAQLRKARCKRIMHQIDHAFKTGESGSEPVAKYVTCQHCDLPAGFLYLNVALAPGAAVMDETTITDAVCALHNHGAGAGNNRPYYYRHVAQIIPCSRLEFFYTGIRQIAVKSEKS